MKNPRNLQSPPPPPPPQEQSADLPSTSTIELQQLAGEAAALETGAGDAPAAAAPVEAPAIPTAELLEGLLTPLAALAGSFHHGFVVAPLKPAEIKMLAVGWGGVLDHYFPGGVGAWGPWGAAMMATAAVIGPRMLIPAPKPNAKETPAAPAAPVVSAPANA